MTITQRRVDCERILCMHDRFSESIYLVSVVDGIRIRIEKGKVRLELPLKLF